MASLRRGGSGQPPGRKVPAGACAGGSRLTPGGGQVMPRASRARGAAGRAAADLRPHERIRARSWPVLCQFRILWNFDDLFRFYFHIGLPQWGRWHRVNSSGVVLGRQKALSKTRLPRAVDAPSAHSGRSCRPDNPFPQLPPRRCAGKSTVLRGEPDMESERAMLSSLDFPTESCPFGQRATLGCAHLMPQHMQHACTPPFKCLSPTGGRMNLN